MSTNEHGDWGRRLNGEDSKERAGAIKEIAGAFKGGATMETAAMRLGMSPRNLYRLLEHDKELKRAVHTACPAGAERKDKSYQKSSLWLRFQNPQTRALALAEIKKVREAAPNARTAAAKLKVSERTYFRLCAIIDGRDEAGSPHSELWLKLHADETRDEVIAKIRGLLEKHTVADVAIKLKVSPRTLYRIFDQFPQIRDEAAA